MTLVTEKEAAEKWCPFARSVEAGGTVMTSYNRVQFADPEDKRVALPTSSYCIGSECMAWQWAKTNVKIADLSAEDRSHYERLGLVRGEGDQELVPAWRTYGYCGAFGKVEP